MQSFNIQKANQFITDNKDKVNKKHRPNFHYAAPVGWMNDPNGFSFFNGQYHLFYQYYPYDSQWGPMHWGHATSDDCIKWEDQKIALAPDQEYDQGGCFSGSAIKKDGKLYLMYTGHLPDFNEENTRQNQNIAYSEDGVTFKKYEKNPVLTEKDIPEGSSIIDFRDPKIFEKDGIYYAVIGSKTIDNKGQVLLYQSEDLLKWSFVSIILPYNKYLGTMVECPDFLSIGGKDYFILSAMDYTDEESGETFPHISWIVEGKLNWETYTFALNDIKELDRGFDFYAPQSVKKGDSYYLISWMQAWNNSMPMHDYQHGWAGQMTLPRNVYHENGMLKQQVSKEIYKYFENKFANDNLEVIEEYCVSDKKIEYLSLELDYASLKEFKIKFSNSNNEELYIIHDRESQSFYIDRGNNTYKINNQKDISLSESRRSLPYNTDILKIELFIDTSSVEVFINDEETLTATFYTETPYDKSWLLTNGKLKVNRLRGANINLSR